jgi:hypothetical protein
VELGASDFGVDLGPLNGSRSGAFGEVDVFDLNITDGADASSSRCLGSVRGFTVQTSYDPASGSASSRDVEVELVTYDDGMGLNGTVSMQGLILNAPNEIAIVGGTGSFRGVRGYALIDLVNNRHLPRLVYHHTLFFL